MFRGGGVFFWTRCSFREITTNERHKRTDQRTNKPHDLATEICRINGKFNQLTLKYCVDHITEQLKAHIHNFFTGSNTLYYPRQELLLSWVCLVVGWLVPSLFDGCCRPLVANINFHLLLIKIININITITCCPSDWL